jgi:RimJ/RimL family protein N-acetyltransferase
MTFPTRYKLLSKSTVTKGAFSLVPIRYEDRLEIMHWRNQQIHHLRQKELLTVAQQEHYFSTVVAQLFEQEFPSQLLFSYLEGTSCIGYGGLVHINWADKHAEISFIMNTDLEATHFAFHWNTYLSMVEEIAFHSLNLHKISTYAFDIRPHLYPALEQAGFQQEAILNEHCLIDGVFKNVVIHSKISPY